MTLLKLMDHCYNHGIEMSCKYEATSDTMIVRMEHKENNRVVVKAIPMVNVIHCSNPDVMIGSYVDEGIELLTSGVREELKTVGVESITRKAKENERRYVR